MLAGEVDGKGWKKREGEGKVQAEAALLPISCPSTRHQKQIEVYAQEDFMCNLNKKNKICIRILVICFNYYNARNTHTHSHRLSTTSCDFLQNRTQNSIPCHTTNKTRETIMWRIYLVFFFLLTKPPFRQTSIFAPASV